MSEIFETYIHDKWFHQGEIIANIPFPLPKNAVKNENDTYQVEIRIEELSTSIVLSQECDLKYDYEARKQRASERKLIPSIMLCKVFDAEQLFTAYKELNPGKEKQWKNECKEIINNANFRYQFIERVPANLDILNEGLSEMVVDFKTYYTLPAEFLYWLIEQSISQRRAKFKSPYLENFIQRFFYYQSRIGIPRQHKTIKYTTLMK